MGSATLNSKECYIIIFNYPDIIVWAMLTDLRTLTGVAWIRTIVSDQIENILADKPHPF